MTLESQTATACQLHITQSTYVTAQTVKWLVMGWTSRIQFSAVTKVFVFHSLSRNKSTDREGKFSPQTSKVQNGGIFISTALYVFRYWRVSTGGTLPLQVFVYVSSDFIPLITLRENSYHLSVAGSLLQFPRFKGNCCRNTRWQTQQKAGLCVRDRHWLCVVEQNSVEQIHIHTDPPRADAVINTRLS
jgi:hypothetical protein